jgi:hypothetical protein
MDIIFRARCKSEESLTFNRGPKRTAETGVRFGAFCTYSANIKRLRHTASLALIPLDSLRPTFLLYIERYLLFVRRLFGLS